MHGLDEPGCVRIVVQPATKRGNGHFEDCFADRHVGPQSPEELTLGRDPAVILGEVAQDGEILGLEMGLDALTSQ